MGAALDTVLVDVHNTATSAVGLTAATAATGDSLTVRAFKDTGKATLENFYLQGSGTRRARILSPRLHDNVTGLSWQANESPTEFLMPAGLHQRLYSADTLTLQLDAAASSDTVGAMFNHYTDLGGIDADLRTWDQIKGKIIALKTMEVDCTTSGTIGAWSDTLLTTTENQLKADYEYAVLGIVVSAAVLCAGVKGAFTGNLRICAPGASPTLKLSDYFVYMAAMTGLPHIPVFNANDRAAIYVSTAANTASATTDVILMLAQLG